MDNKIKILYCEDENITKKLVMTYLNMERFHCFTASNGIEGLEIVKKEKPDILITDINMPEMTGIELIEEISKLDIPQPHIIITTSHKDTKFLLNAIKHGVNNFIVKPIERQQIEIVFEKAIHEITVQKELEYQKILNKTILDFQDNLIITFKEDEIINVNKSFLDFFNIKDLQEFNNSNESLSSVFISSNLDYKNHHEWVEKIKKTNNEKVTVQIMSEKLNKKITFLVKYSHINTTNDHFILSMTDITELEEESKKFEIQATTDELTKVYNRLKFNQIMEKEISKSKRYNMSFSIIMFDIDKFKTINDTYGHQIGDSVLIEISSLIKSKIRDTDIIARWGGEEFMILTTCTNIKQAKMFAEKLRFEIENFNFKGVPKVTSSFGVGEFSLNETQDELIKRIDDALYMSKEKGRNRVTVSHYKPNN